MFCMYFFKSSDSNLSELKKVNPSTFSSTLPTQLTLRIGSAASKTCSRLFSILLPPEKKVWHHILSVNIAMSHFNIFSQSLWDTWGITCSKLKMERCLDNSLLCIALLCHHGTMYGNVIMPDRLVSRWTRCNERARTSSHQKTHYGKSMILRRGWPVLLQYATPNITFANRCNSDFILIIILLRLFTDVYIFSEYACRSSRYDEQNFHIKNSKNVSHHSAGTYDRPKD